MKKKKSTADIIFTVCNTIFMVAFVIITLYPVLNTLAISLNDGIDTVRGGIHLLPRKFTWKNYTTVIHKQNIMTGAYITVLRTIIGTLVSLVANALLAFIVSRKRFLFRSQLSLFWVITMYVWRYDSNIPGIQRLSPDWYFLGVYCAWCSQCIQYAGHEDLYAGSAGFSGRICPA